MRLIFKLLIIIGSLNAYGATTVCDGAPTHAHSNGGGAVANTAFVDSRALIGPNASVCEYGFVYGDSQVLDSAKVYGRAKLIEGSIVSENSEIYGNAVLTSIPGTQAIKVMGTSKIFGNANISDSAVIKGATKVYGNAKVKLNATIDGSAQVYGNATVTDNSVVRDSAKVYCASYVEANEVVDGYKKVCRKNLK